MNDNDDVDNGLDGDDNGDDDMMMMTMMMMVTTKTTTATTTTMMMMLMMMMMMLTFVLPLLRSLSVYVSIALSLSPSKASHAQIRRFHTLREPRGQANFV